MDQQDQVIDPDELLADGGIPRNYVYLSKIDIDHLICPICLNILWKPVACAQDRCFQSFCDSCITKWINANLPQSFTNNVWDSGPLPQSFTHNMQEELSQPDSPYQHEASFSMERSYSSNSEHDTLDHEWPQVNNSSIASAPKCPKCKRVFKQTSIPIIHNLLEAIEFHCVHPDCQHKPKYEQFQKHIMVCEFRKMACCGCQQVFLQSELSKHQQTCESVQVLCNQCTTSMKRMDLKANHTRDQCIQKQFELKDVQIGRLQEQIESLKLNNTNLETRIDKISKGEFENLAQFSFKTSFTTNYSFQGGNAKLVRNSFNSQKQKNDFLHFYIIHKIKTQSIFGLQWKMRVVVLQGNLLLGICSSLCHHSIDFIINRLGEVKKKEWNENKYKHVRKVNFTFGEGDVLQFQFMPFSQTLRIMNETKHQVCRFENSEIIEMGDSFYSFCSLETAGDTLQFI